MSILSSPLPDYVTIDGKNYAVNTDFKVWISLEGIIFNSDISMPKRIAKVLSLCYIDLPPSLDKALDKIIEFYNYMEKRNNSRDKYNIKGNRNFSFEEDAPYIYSAFLKEYNIDLLKTDMHWWIFLSLFKSLGQDNRLFEIIKYRTIDISKIKNKEERAFYIRQRQRYRLSDTRSDRERDRDLSLALNMLI